MSLTHENNETTHHVSLWVYVADVRGLSTLSAAIICQFAKYDVDGIGEEISCNAIIIITTFHSTYTPSPPSSPTHHRL